MINNDYKKMTDYKGFTITKFGKSVTVFNEGEEEYFENIELAKKYIDKLLEVENV